MIHENYERESHKLNTCNELSARDMLIDADRYEKRGEHNRARALRERADDLARDRDYTKGAYHYTHGWIIFVPLVGAYVELIERAEPTTGTIFARRLNAKLW